MSVVTGGGSREHTLGSGLLLLCFFLAIWQPLTLALTASNALAALPARGWPLALLLFVRVIVTACGMAAAIAMYHRRSGATIIAAAALVLSGCTEVFVYTTPYFPSNRLPGDTPWHVAWSITVHGVWLAYLLTSSRARRALDAGGTTESKSRRIIE